MRRTVIALGMWALGALGISAAQAEVTSTLPPPPASVCASPPAETEPGSIHMWPGRWRNPSHYGLGWDFFYGDGENTMYLTWFTYDANGRPVWLHGGDAAPISFNAVTGERTWQGTLFEVHWTLSGGKGMTPVGAVSVTFPRETTTRAAVRWKWQDVDNATQTSTYYDECLYDKRDSASQTNATNSVTTLNEAFSSNWFYDGPDDDPLNGWGVDLLVEVDHGGPFDPDYVETATAAIFDAGSRPVWLQSVDDWKSDAPPASTFGAPGRGMMRYSWHNAAGTHPALAQCADESCIQVKYEDHGTGNDNRFARSMSDGRRGTMSLHASVPLSVTGLYAVQWPPSGGTNTFPDPVPVFRFDGNHIMVDRSVCRVAHREDRCNFIVSWVADEPASTTISRLDLRTHSYTPIPQNDNFQFVDSLGVDDRVQYQITYHSAAGGDGTLLTPEVRVLLQGAVADQNLDPVDCVSGPGCDLHNHVPTVGAVNGEASVEGGAASYSIPFAVPPGRNGMQPGLALTYSSRAGNGLAGMGWNLSGLSSIYRCPRTVDQDGHSAPVRMDANDALCLDGQRLVLTAGTYGVGGATYRTEIDTFSRITQYGSLADNSACFRVEEKSGRISQYGAVVQGSACGSSHNSRVIPGNASATLGWLLDQVNDRVGNNIIYGYGIFGTGENLLQRIYYTGYGAGSSSLQGNRVVQIGYESRPDTDRSSSYLAGGLTEQTQRLQSIQFYAAGTPGTMYTLDYHDAGLGVDFSAYSGRSLLQSVTQCDISTQACLKPTMISWKNSSEDTILRRLDVPGIPASVPGDSKLDRAVYPIGDLDGDGVREIFVTQHQSDDSQLHGYLVKQTADRTTASALEVTSLLNQFYTSKDRQADFDGDGRTDLLGINSTSASTLSLVRWTGGRGAPFTMGSFESLPTNIPVPLDVLSTDDVDGDGRPDLITRVGLVGCDGGRSKVNSICFYRNISQFSPGAGIRTVAFEPGVSIYTWSPSLNYGVSAPGDFNGDGVRDILVTAFNSEFITTVLISVPSYGQFSYAGCQDSSRPYFRPCPSSAFNLPANGYGYSAVGTAVFWQDINGDGLTDLLFATPPGTGCSDGPNPNQARNPITLPDEPPVQYGSWCLKLSNGRGFDPVQNIEDHTRALLADNSGALRYASRLPVADIDGDGRPNLLYPVALAARRCELSSVTFHRVEGQADGCAYPPVNPGDDSGTSSTSSTDSTCTVQVWMCSNDPTSNFKDGSGGKYSLPEPDTLNAAVNNLAHGDHVENVYSPIIHDSRLDASDHSAYVMAAVRFVQTAHGFRADSVNLDQTDRAQYPNDDTNPRIAHQVVMTLAQPGANNLSDDLYGDGLVDLVTRVGCFNQGVSTGACAFVGEGADGPAAIKVASGRLNVDVSMNQLTSGQVTLINENVGVLERSGEAPYLPELVDTIVDGLGRTSTWDYFPLSSKAGRSASELPLYALPSDEQSYTDQRHFYFRSSMPVVSTLKQSNGVGGTTGFRSWKYGYAEAMYNRFGRGFQGFRTIVKEQLADSGFSGRILRTRTDFLQKFPLTGKIEKMVTGLIDTAQDGGKLGQAVKPISEESYVWACNVSSPSTPCDTVNGGAPANFPYVTTKTAKTYDLAKAETNVVQQVSQIDTANTFDASGNVTEEVITSSDKGSSAFVMSTVSHVQKHYLSVTNDWWPDKLDYSLVWHDDVQYTGSHALPTGYTSNPSSLKVKTKYTWNDATHLAASVEVQPADLGLDTAAYQQQHSLTTYTYPSPNYGLPSSVTVTGQSLTGANGGASDSRTTSMFYTTAAGVQDGGYFLQRKVDPAAIATTQFVNPVDGQVLTSTDGLGNTTTYQYDVFGRLVQTNSVDSAGAVLHQPVHMAWLPCSNGQCVTTGSDVAVGENYNSGSGPDSSNETYAAYRVTTVQNGSPTQVVWYDALGRAVKQAKRGGDNASTFVVTDTGYDAMGAVQRQSTPFFANAATSYATQFTYDRLGRVVTKRAPGSTLDPLHGDVLTHYTYDGNRTDIQVQPSSGNCSGNAANLCMSMHRYLSVLGLVRTEDAAGGVTRFWYDGAGRTVASADANAPVSVPVGKAMVSTYDALGRRIRLADPNQGTWNFTYNPAGELLTQVDARGLATTVAQRDADGRTLLQTAEQYAGITTTGAPITKNLVKDTWTYDATRKALLQQQKRSVDEFNSQNVVVRTSSPWQESYAYDAAGRTLGITTTIDQVDHLSMLSTLFQYDSHYGREKAIEYPSGLLVQSTYNRYGYMHDMLDGTSGERYWGIDSRDAWGNPTLEYYGNGLIGEYAADASTGQALTRQWRGGESESTPVQDKVTYTYDSLGNLSTQTRWNGSQGDLTQSYVYDPLQRLVVSQPPAAIQKPTVTYSYDALGNFKSKSDFSATGANAYLYQVPAGDTTPFAKKCGPNVAQQITLDSNSPVYFHCDENGNVIHNTGQSGFAERSTVYDATNRPTLIVSGSYSAKFTYASTGERVKEILQENLPDTATGTRLTTLIRGPRGYEEESVAGKTSRVLRHEIGDVSVVITRTDSGTGPVLPGDQLDLYYKHNDRLGSPLAISGRSRAFSVLDGTQIVSSRRSFDPFGKTFNANFSARTPSGALGLTGATRKGFTGQEHLDSLGVIHMNGRIYDFRVGKFLSVDPIIGNSLSSQSMNPYSYIGNNPLSGVDPTGYIACSEVSSDQSNASGSCDVSDANGKTTSISYSFNANGDIGISRSAGAASAAVSTGVLANSGANGIGPAGPSSKPSSGSSADIGGMVKTVGQQASAMGTNAVRGMFPENAALSDQGGSGRKYSNDVGGIALGVYNTAARAVNDVGRLGWLAASSGQYGGPGDFFPTFAVSPEMQRGAAIGEGVTFAATIFGGPERILARGEAPLASVLEGHAAGQGFTGVFDASTGRILLRPSTADAVIPEGWVARAGGHVDVSAALGGNRAGHSGFAVILQENGSLNITWRSGSLNPAPRYLVPSELRTNIVDAVERATGRTVNQ